MHLDAVIFGGGAAGLWLLDDLVRAGRSVVLLESGDLGGGQTIASQGIIHGGLKYTLQGMLSRSAANIRDMPLLWRECLAGEREPNLNQTRVRSESCFLWRTDSVASRLGMIGARVGLRVAAESINEADRPEILAGCPGTVAQMAEQVISPTSFIQNLAVRHRERILKIDPRELNFVANGPGQVERIELANPSVRESLTLHPAQVIFTAGAGNAELRRCVGLSADAMQRRPLHMVMVRGHLAPMNGHCVDGAKTRVTITSDVDSAGRTIWQIGGQIAEDGVALDDATLIARAADELAAVIPGFQFEGVEAATYRVDRAEGRTVGGGRPESCQILRNGNCLTAWPTKLALVPELSRQLASMLQRADAVNSAPVELASIWPRPSVALPPWDAAKSWRQLASTSTPRKKAA